MPFIKKPVVVAITLAFLMAGIFTPPVLADTGSQNNQNSSSQATIEENISLKLRPDGTYRLRVSMIGTKRLTRDLPFLSQGISKLLNEENFQVRVTSSNTGEADLNVKIKDLTFSEAGTMVLDLILVSMLSPEKPHELIPEKYRSTLLKSLPYENWSTIDRHPTLLLKMLSSESLQNLVEQFLGKNPFDLVNDELNERVFPKFEGGSTKNIYSLLPVILPPPVPMDAELFSKNSSFWQLVVENIESQDFSWADSTLSLNLDVKVSGEPLLNENLVNRLPATVNMSFKDISPSGSGNNKWKVDLTVESDAKLPNFEENEVWQVTTPFEIQQLVGLEEAVLGSSTKSSSFEIEVPKGAELSEFQQEPDSTEGQVYEWTGDGADKMMDSLSSGNENIKADYSNLSGGEDEGGLPIVLIGIALAVVVIGIISFIFIRKRYF